MGCSQRGVLSKGGFYNGSNPSLFGETLRGPAYFIRRVDLLLRLRMIYCSCGYFITRADTDVT